MAFFVEVNEATNRVCGTGSFGGDVAPGKSAGRSWHAIDETTFRAIQGMDRTMKAVWSPTDKTVQIVEKDESVLTAQAWAELRRERDRLLAETDHTQVPDFPKAALYTAYRQELRDLPAKTTDPFNPPWPTLTAEAQGYLRAK